MHIDFEELIYKTGAVLLLIMLSMYFYFSFFGQSIPVKVMPETVVIEQIKRDCENKYINQISTLQKQVADATKVDPNTQFFTNGLIVFAVFEIVAISFWAYVKYSILQKELELKEKKEAKK